LAELADDAEHRARFEPTVAGLASPAGFLNIEPLDRRGTRCIAGGRSRRSRQRHKSAATMSDNGPYPTMTLF
jgi:hypothetical protein